jgi:tetratricopeptide (TPR) repeat protein
MPERDAAERAQLLRIAVLLGGPVLIIGAFTLYFAAARLHAPPAVILVCLVLLLPATWGVILLVESGTGRSAHAVVTALHAGHARAPLQGFSRQEALVAQGRPEEAVTAYRQRLIEHPEDVAAMVALARLLSGVLDDREAAEELYGRARASLPGQAWERVISNDLIDFYRRMGMDGKLRNELARFAELHRGTLAGSAARDQLNRLETDPPQES